MRLKIRFSNIYRNIKPYRYLLVMSTRQKDVVKSSVAERSSQCRHIVPETRRDIGTGFVFRFDKCPRMGDLMRRELPRSSHMLGSPLCRLHARSGKRFCLPNNQVCATTRNPLHAPALSVGVGTGPFLSLFIYPVITPFDPAREGCQTSARADL